MEVVARPIEVVAWFDREGIPRPVRFKMTMEDESEIVVKVDKLLKMDKEKLAGNMMLKFTCQSTFKGIQRCFEIKYELLTCKWMLYKI